VLPQRDRAIRDRDDGECGYREGDGIELSMTRWTSSLGIKWANDHMARCASFIALPSS
jgi:hypothetical protein